MRKVEIGEILQMEPGEVVPSFAGKILAVGKRATGTSEYGPWSFQNVTIKGDDGETVRVKLKNCDEIPVEAVGKTLYVESRKGERGLAGAVRADDEYRGKVSPIVQVDNRATVSVLEGGATGGARREADDGERREERESQHAQFQQGVREVREMLGRAANGLLLCFDAAAYIRNEVKKKHDIELGPDQVERLAVHLSIMLDRAGQVDKLPHGRMNG